MPVRHRKGRRTGRSAKMVGTFVIAAACLLLLRLMFEWPQLLDQGKLDAVIVPGGGLLDDGTPYPWVAARLDAALQHKADTHHFLVLSRGTTHKPPPLDGAGFPVDEAAASARYLVSHGVAPSRVLLESWSLDTIGNAAFARLMHAEPRAWRRVHVVTSSFHMPRTRQIFEWVFSLPPLRGPAVALTFEEVVESGLPEEQRESRQAKEAQALQKLRDTTMLAVTSLAQLHAFLFEQHAAYAAPTSLAGRETDRSRAQGALAGTY